MLIFGQAAPSGRVAGNCSPSAVHGQPVHPAQGGGSFERVGQCILINTCHINNDFESQSKNNLNMKIPAYSFE